MIDIDSTRQQAAYAAVASGYDDADFFGAEVGARLLERLGLMAIEPAVLLDLGCGTGRLQAGLGARFPDSLQIGLDRSLAMLQAGAATRPRIAADAGRLPLPDASVDLVIANLLLPDCNDPVQVLGEARRVLRSPGLFLFSTLGPDTLRELRDAWAAADDEPHVHAFADMHNIGDALVRAGFREPVMDVEHLTVTYADTGRLVADLRAIAATNMLVARRRGLTSPRRWQAMLSALETSRNERGRLTVTMEVVTGQAWAGETGRAVPMEGGEARFPLSRLRDPRPRGLQ